MQEQLTPDFGDYELLDTGDFEKLERFGRYVTRRPEPQAIWRRALAEEEWRRRADASFRRAARGAVGRAVFHRPGRQAAAVGNLLPVYAVGFAGGGAGDALCFWQPSSSRNPVSRSAAQA